MATWKGPQVLGNFSALLWKGSPEELSGTAEGLAEVQAAQEQWQSCIRRFLTSAAGAGIPKLERKATAAWLHSLNTTLLTLTGEGLEQFRTSSSPALTLGEAPPPGTGKTLVVAADQHSVGLCAANFLDQKLHLAVELLWDPPHRTWNNDKNGITHGGAWETVLLYGFPFNVNFGPWLGKGWLQKLREARAEYTQHLGSSDCSLFRSLLPLIARDRNEQHKVGDPDWVAARWDDLCNHPDLHTAGPNFTLCRWYSWDTCFSHWDRWHHSRLLLMLYCGILEGLISKDPTTRALEVAGLKKRPEPKKETMKEAKVTAEKLRAKGKNNLHVALLVLANPLLQRNGRTLHTALAPMKHWHGKQVKACASPSTSLEWWQKQAAGDFLSPVRQTWATLTNLTELQYCGFALSPTELLPPGADEEASAFVEEDRFAEWHVHLLCSLQRCRLAQFAWHTEGPGRLAAWNYFHPFEPMATLQFLRKAWEGWERCSKSTHPALVRACTRSWIRRPWVRLVLDALREQGWATVPAEVCDIIRNAFRVGSTKVIEDAFQRARTVEERAQSNQVVSLPRMWHTLTQRQVLDAVHRIDTVDFRQCSRKRALEELPKKLSPKLFEPQAAAAKLPLSKVVSQSKQVL